MQMPLEGGIIGCGYFGRIQKEAWARIPEAEIVAACDLDRELAARTAPRAYTSAAEMFARERLDFVDIATRPESHLSLIRLSAAHKVPAICQKPIATDWREAVEMVETAEAAGVPLMIHENWRWQPWYRAAKEMIAQDEIGKPLAYWFRHRKRDGLGGNAYPDQPYFRRMPRLLIHETLVHYIDTARFLFGEIASVYAQVRRINPAIQGEDQALLLLTHESGLQGSIDGHRFLEPEPFGPAMGEAGLEGESGCLRVLATGDILLGLRPVWRNEVQEGYKGDSVYATQRHFIECLASGRPFETGGRGYLLGAFAAVEAAYRSAAEGRRVCLSEVTAGRA
jgi:predicted dehydrogenase